MLNSLILRNEFQYNANVNDVFDQLLIGNKNGPLVGYASKNLRRPIQVYGVSFYAMFLIISMVLNMVSVFFALRVNFTDPGIIDTNDPNTQCWDE